MVQRHHVANVLYMCHNFSCTCIQLKVRNYEFSKYRRHHDFFRIRRLVQLENHFCKAHAILLHKEAETNSLSVFN